VNESIFWFLPFGLQGLAMGFDEFGFHHRRTVPHWEWIGHALDTAVFLACLAIPLLLPPTSANVHFFGWLASFSCLLITKDEFIHQRLCSGGEHWVHAVLFILHPIVLIATAFLWMRLGSSALSLAPTPGLTLTGWMLILQVLLVSGFLTFQVLYWSRRYWRDGKAPGINNAIYDELGERWYTATDDPVALLRAESRLRTAWVITELREHFGESPLAILDVACGGGFLSNPLATAGHHVTGIDLSEDSLAVARRHDATRSVTYVPMDARRLAFPDGQFDAVCMMDFLEHLAERDEVISEASRVLKPGGWFFFHTFNRTPISGLIAIKGVEWFVKNTPQHMHVYELFLKPAELRALCTKHELVVEVMHGVRPRVLTVAFLKLLLTGRVSDQFQFVFTRTQSVGYCGRARKLARAPAQACAVRRLSLDATQACPT
jgi:2-polyprenyl-6-hydroxyphenyl methylase/3-demethylubiquinone-9 3-methyltransferase